MQQAAQLGRMVRVVASEWWTTGVLFLPVGKAFREDPYPTYRKLRERDPIHRSPGADGWVLTRHRDVKAVLADARFSSDPRTFAGWEARRARNIRLGIADADVEPPPTMLSSDPPVHTRLRNIVSKAFTPRAALQLRGRIETLVDESLSAAASRGEMELVRDLAVPLPVTVIAEMLGIPSEDRDTFKRWSDDFANTLGRFNVENALRARRSGEEFSVYIEKVAEARRSEPRDDLVSALATTEIEGDGLTGPELATQCALLLAAGNETTTNLISNGVLALLRHPDQLEALRSQPDLIDGAIEELLRYDSPVQGASRNAPEDIEYEGVTFRKGEQVVLLIGGANRDPETYADPDRLDLQRAEEPHLSFGFGRHSCLGAQLARLEAKIAIGELVRRFPDLRLATDRVERNGHIVLRGVKALPIRL